MKVSRSILILITSFSLVFIFATISTSRADSVSSQGRISAFKRHVIHDVNFQGVKTFPQSDIKKLLLTRKNHWYNFLSKRRLSKTSVSFDVGTIQRFYRRRGFLNPIVRDSIYTVDTDKAVVLFIVDEGRRTNLRNIALIDGIDYINEKYYKTLKPFITGEPINGVRALSAGFMLRDHYNDYGYPYTRIIKRFDFSVDSTFADLIYVVAESVYTVNGEVKISRLGKTKPFVVRRELLVDESKAYSRKNNIESEQRLYMTGLFRLVGLHRVDSSAVIENDTCRVDYILNYEERKSVFVNFSLGIGREEKFETVFRTSGLIGYRNIKGTGRRIALGIQPSFQITDPEGPLKNFSFSSFEKKLNLKMIKSTFEINYLEPWPLGFKVPAELKFIWEPHTFEPVLDYRFDKIGGEILLSRELDRFTIAKINFGTDYINIKDVPEDQQEFYRQQGDNQIRRKISLFGERDTRDNLFAPQHGSYSFVELNYVGHALGGDFNYLKAQFSWSRYNNILGQNIFASRIWFGTLDDIGKNGNSSVDDRFLLGGATTIRGYVENALGPVFTEADNPGDQLGKPKGGKYLLLTNLELRRPLFWRFGGTVFLDAGNTYWRLAEITPLSIALSSGLGLQFFTPIGPIRFDYAVRFKKEFDLGAGNYHLSILYAF